MPRCGTSQRWKKYSVLKLKYQDKSYTKNYFVSKSASVSSANVKFMVDYYIWSIG